MFPTRLLNATAMTEHHDSLFRLDCLSSLLNSNISC